MTVSDMITGLSRRRLLLFALSVLLLAVVLRVVGIGWSYSNNGVDEGVMIERVSLVDAGYALYTELPCDQAPLAFLMGSALWGDVTVLRLFSATLSLAAVVCCMYISNRLGGRTAMLATGLLLAVDFAFVRESRLFSLDAMSASFLAFSVLAFVKFLGGESRSMLVAAGLMVGLATSVKLLGGLGLLGMVLFFAFETVRGRMKSRFVMSSVAVLVLSAAVPVALLMAYLGPSDMLRGMVLDQGHRGFDVLMKLSLVAFFGLNLAYALPLAKFRATWGEGIEHRFLLSVTVVIIGFMVLQPLLFLHHMVFLSPLLAVLAGSTIASVLGTRYEHHETVDKVFASRNRHMRIAVTSAFVAGLVISSGLSIYGLVAQQRPAQLVYGEYLAELTDPDDWVICGDPLIAVYADRLMPPEVANVAERQYPELTSERLQQAVLDYDVSAVVICYFLNDFVDLPGFLEANGFILIAPEEIHPGSDAVLDLFQEGIEPVTFYVRS